MTTGHAFKGALKWAFVVTWGRRLMTIGVTFALAALLGPRTFGVVALATIFIGLLSVLLEAGLSTAIIQRENLEPEHLDSAFWMNICMCVALAGVAVLLSGFWARINSLPELQPVVVVLSVSLLFQGLIIVQTSILQRAMDFKRLALRTNAATVVGGIVGIAWAVLHPDVWALVAQQLTFEAVSVITLFTAGGWRPHFRFSRRHAHDLLGYSVSVFFANLGTFFYRRSDAFLLGILCGPVVVGVYRLCDRLVDTVLVLTMRPLSMTALPHFSRLQRDPEGLRTAVAWCIRFSLTTAVPTLFVLGATSPWVLGIVGEEWAIGSAALAMLCIVGVAQAMTFFAGPLLFAVDRPRLRAGATWFLAAVSTASVLLAGLAVRDADESVQLLGMSASRALVFVVIVIPLNLFIVKRVTGFSPRSIVGWLPAPAGAGGVAIALGATYAITGVLDDVRPLVAFAIAGGTISMAALSTLVFLDKNLRSRLRSGMGRRSLKLDG